MKQKYTETVLTAESAFSPVLNEAEVWAKYCEGEYGSRDDNNNPSHDIQNAIEFAKKVARHMSKVPLFLKRNIRKTKKIRRREKTVQKEMAVEEIAFPTYEASLNHPEFLGRLFVGKKGTHTTSTCRLKLIRLIKKATGYKVAKREVIVKHQVRTAVRKIKCRANSGGVSQGILLRLDALSTTTKKGALLGYESAFLGCKIGDKFKKIQMDAPCRRQDYCRTFRLSRKQCLPRRRSPSNGVKARIFRKGRVEAFLGAFQPQGPADVDSPLMGKSSWKESQVSCILDYCMEKVRKANRSKRLFDALTVDWCELNNKRGVDFSWAGTIKFGMHYRGVLRKFDITHVHRRVMHSLCAKYELGPHWMEAALDAVNIPGSGAADYGAVLRRITKFDGPMELFCTKHPGELLPLPPTITKI